jgi:hypothetical protein
MAEVTIIFTKATVFQQKKSVLGVMAKPSSLRTSSVCEAQHTYLPQQLAVILILGSF